MRYIKINAFEEKGEGLNVIRVYIVWGLKMQNRSNCHFTDFKCKGKTVFDEAFDMNKEGCQESMLVSKFYLITYGHIICYVCLCACVYIYIQPSCLSLSCCLAGLLYSCM